ncbi:hypothetical protein ISN45_Aa08g001630 [Arabidopsis thaliana x Arabidopsis arenosa]|uniref:Transmembrane protein n=1 Tax=Arabidopsis thaliana x Arabidopsis arenosa TaxID=1240361 RepID=A0A8T1XDD9_9BRAS|nr:hypothetical protein ISN45_Aa08g001630 [Arabidopsis thaliana x Arabidopsis arenosa]
MMSLPTVDPAMAKEFVCFPANSIDFLFQLVMVLGDGFQRLCGFCDLHASCCPPHLHQDLFVLALFLSGFWVVSLPLFELVILSGWSFWLENFSHMSSCFVAFKS